MQLGSTECDLLLDRLTRLSLAWSGVTRGVFVFEIKDFDSGEDL
jgi:hypothetical protein